MRCRNALAAERILLRAALPERVESPRPPSPPPRDARARCRRARRQSARRRLRAMTHTHTTENLRHRRTWSRACRRSPSRRAPRPSRSRGLPGSQSRRAGTRAGSALRCRTPRATSRSAARACRGGRGRIYAPPTAREGGRAAPANGERDRRPVRRAAEDKDDQKKKTRARRRDMRYARVRWVSVGKCAERGSRRDERCVGWGRRGRGRRNENARLAICALWALNAGAALKSERARTCTLHHDHNTAQRERQQHPWLRHALSSAPRHAAAIPFLLAKGRTRMTSRSSSKPPSSHLLGSYG